MPGCVPSPQSVKSQLHPWLVPQTGCSMIKWMPELLVLSVYRTRLMIEDSAGLSDPVYAEAYVTVHQYDILLDCTIINKTNETLQNVCLELATMGDLKLVERPHNYTLPPGGTNTIRYLCHCSCKLCSKHWPADVLNSMFKDFVFDMTSKHLALLPLFGGWCALCSSPCMGNDPLNSQLVFCWIWSLRT